MVGIASINLELLQELDVEEEINYSEAPFEDVVGAVDVVLDTVGGDTQERSWSLLKPGGILLSTVQAPSEEKAAAHGVRQRMIATWPPIGPTLTEVTELVDHGDIRPVVSLVLPLEDIRKAHTLIEGRHTRGKIALRVVP